MAAMKIGDIGPAVDLILQPLLLEALVAIDSGKALEDALPADTDVALLDAAVERLRALFSRSESMVQARQGLIDL